MPIVSSSSNCPPFGRARMDQIFFRCRSSNSSSSSSHFCSSATMLPPSVVSSHNRTANPVRETTAGSSLYRFATFRSMCFIIPFDGFCLRWLFLFLFFLFSFV
eukprot:TRINITY_DN410_c5_g1_i3.p1 TRINITY_DN410_c5_g1~~TRINITY_DN410_c5_g1_i3.p1  ORF type:complete len:103 (+),score=8.54 TRINITY_DN410_c5_g1_i3:504-812(+)